MPFWAPDIGIDLGTENVSLYVRGRGVVISEPALVVLDREDRHTVQAVGNISSGKPSAFPISANRESSFPFPAISMT